MQRIALERQKAGSKIQASAAIRAPTEASDPRPRTGPLARHWLATPFSAGVATGGAMLAAADCGATTGRRRSEAR